LKGTILTRRILRNESRKTRYRVRLLNYKLLEIELPL
jgi:hypothetical protein